MRVLPFVSLLLVGCGGPSSTLDPEPDGGVDGPPISTGCELVANTTPTSTINAGCALLERDTSSCRPAREALGLGGWWLKFSCRVAITKPSPTIVQLVSDDQPDHASNYFPAANACHADYQPAAHNPNMIGVKAMKMSVAVTPTPGGRVMMLGTVGLAVNGVALFNNMAAHGDDIYVESRSFDQCQGHPTGTSVYHHHSEPYSITYDDANFVGVMMDGYPVYGRRDADGSMPVLDGFGGHSSATADSTTPVYHYHINLQTSTTPGTVGQSVWFITRGMYAATPGTCEGCQ
jgi:hypothetical protein